MREIKASKYQLHCPKCHYEFTYDNGYYDTNISRLGVEIRDICLQLANYNLLPFDEKRRRTDWWLRTKRTLAEKQKELSELKAFRKINDQQVKSLEYTIFKEIVKEKIGEKQYYQILESVTKEIEAYKISGLMRHEYTRKNSTSNVISVNKL